MCHRLDWFRSGAERKIGGRHGKAAPRWFRQICFLFHFINIVVIWDLLEEIWNFVNIWTLEDDIHGQRIGPDGRIYIFSFT